MKKAIIIGALCFLLLLTSLLSSSTVASAQVSFKSDFLSNFDNYVVGTVNPFPWTYFANGCGTSGLVNNTLAPNAQPWAHSPPNFYTIQINGASCDSGGGVGSSSAAYIKATFNATQSNVNATFYMTGTYVDSTNAFLNINSSLQRSSVYCTNSAWNSNPLQYTKCSAVISARGGLPVTVQVNVSSGAGNAGQFVALDDFSIVGAAAYTNSQGGPAYNLELYNTSSAGPYWFDPSTYTGSYITVQGNGIANDSRSWANAPAGGLDVAAIFYNSLASTSLVTVHVGQGVGSYYRTLFAKASGTTAVYLDPPANVFAYTVEVIDVFTTLPNGTAIYISPSASSYNLTSGYLDSSGTFPTYLQGGTYHVLVVSGSTIFYNGLMTTPAGTTAGPTVVQIQITNSTHTVTNDIFTDIQTGVSATASSVTASFNDTGDHTTMANITFYNENVSGTFALGVVCYSTTSHGSCTVISPIGYVSTSFTINAKLQGQFFIEYTFLSTKYAGTNTIGPYAVAGPGVFGPQPIPQNNYMLGIGALLSSSYISTYDVFLNAIGVLIVLGLAWQFGPGEAAFGTFVMALIAAVLAFAGFITLSSIGGTSFLLLIVLLASIKFLKHGEKGQLEYASE
jgi:hypothetical protein